MKYLLFIATKLVARLLITLLFATLLTSREAKACASCGCSLNSDWESQGYSIETGLKLDIIYNYINQNQLRHGTDKVSASSVPLGQELETSTRSNYETLGLDYVFNADWSVSLLLPYVIRDHTTLGPDHVSYDTSGTSSLGDVRLVGRYQGFFDSHHFGVELGVKLPTGAFTDTFRSGAALDRGLQPGSGTTDLIAGLYYFDKLSAHWGYFAEALVQTALDSRREYRSATFENVTLGVRYTGIDRITPQFQLNGKFAGRDTGAQADNLNSGGTLLYLSPGVTFEATKNVAVFAFFQVPVYQNVNGYQLAPKWTLSVGMRASF